MADVQAALMKGVMCPAVLELVSEALESSGRGPERFWPFRHSTLSCSRTCRRFMRFQQLQTQARGHRCMSRLPHRLHAVVPKWQGKPANLVKHVSCFFPWEHAAGLGCRVEGGSAGHCCP